VIDKAVKSPAWRVKPIARKRARSLRTNATNAERAIWYLVRAHRLNGVGFRRQTPIGPYIVDFVSHAAKLVIELDGGQHFEDAQELRDARRDSFLRSRGFRVLRFSNYDVMTNKEGVWDVIAAAVDAAEAPSLPSPASGGGEVLPARGGTRP
jgi:very-short-patch-repair endonuclease